MPTRPFSTPNGTTAGYAWECSIWRYPKRHKVSLAGQCSVKLSATNYIFLHQNRRYPAPLRARGRDLLFFLYFFKSFFLALPSKSFQAGFGIEMDFGIVKARTARPAYCRLGLRRLWCQNPVKYTQRGVFVQFAGVQKTLPRTATDNRLLECPRMCLKHARTHTKFAGCAYLHKAFYLCLKRVKNHLNRRPL